MEIKKIRESRGMLQYELAARMGVKAASVSAWENDQSYPTAENLLKLAVILDCSVDELLGRDRTAGQGGQA